MSPIFSAPEKRFDPIIVFTPHYGGDAISCRRHQDMVAALGFDSLTCALTFDLTRTWGVTNTWRAGIIEQWRQELKATLDGLPLERDKIIFSFSFPSVATASLFANSPRVDVRAWVCDGGPFLDIRQCIVKYLTFNENKADGWKKEAMAALGYLMMGGPLFDWRVRQWLPHIFERMPILSVRSGKDLLVPETAIAKFFAVNPRLNIMPLRLPEAGHLEGLKTCPELYKRQVSEFLVHAAVPQN